MASRVLENRKVKIILIAAATLFAIYLAIGSWVNRIYVAKQTVNNAWTALKQNCDHRVELLSEWGNFIVRYAPEAAVTLQGVKKAYSQAKQEHFTVDILHQKESLQRFVNLQQMIMLTLQESYTFISSQPTLAANPNFKLINNDTEIVELQIAYTAKRLNQSIASYNDTIATIPGSWVNIFLKYPLFFTFSLPERVIPHKGTT